MDLDSKYEDAGFAPVEMMSEFLVLVTNGKMTEALALSHRIREIEPENDLIRQYIGVLNEYINEGFEEEDNEENEEDEKEEDGDGDGDGDGVEGTDEADDTDEDDENDSEDDSDY
mmetsp:Transcript_14625/g.14727  ORF Transcript_14625/g.14727 Transcript_14625/m.14727 type:complete len:115 (-) Transcript_14625:150-494(-)|eukprot:CAMPEP_0182433466 /NCGR_PEP_ID=MMETSP1167-20130531/63420_1 /TAXON_ID=2988 /ORGANISM="Mallomonas Sp, Strain CCMP3275" /LENGTH=114 /DNA_ID=CAMNT_0024622191 /DNA_START=133 /DNA_END=477 /DNA_ORIENTATION=+